MVALRSIAQIISAGWKPANGEGNQTTGSGFNFNTPFYILLPEQPTFCAADSVGDFWATKIELFILVPCNKHRMAYALSNVLLLCKNCSALSSSSS